MQEFLDAIDTQAIDELSDEQVRQVLAILERAGY